MDWFFAISAKGDNFCDFLFDCTPPSPVWKGVYSLRKKIAPRGSKGFPHRVDLFSEGDKNNFDRVICLENVSIPLNSEPNLT